MRSNQIKKGLTVAVSSSQGMKYGNPQRAVILADTPFISPRSAGFGGSEPTDVPEGLLDDPVVPKQWTTSMPRPAESWTERQGHSYNRRSAGALCYFPDTMHVRVVPTRHIQGEWEETVTALDARRRAERAERDRHNQAHRDLVTRFKAANESLPESLRLREHAGPEYSSAWDVRLTVAQFEALVAAATGQGQE